MSWVKISDVRYENSEDNAYISYLPATTEHDEYWYLNDGTTDEAIKGGISPIDLGVPLAVVESDPSVEDTGNEDEKPGAYRSAPAIGDNSGDTDGTVLSIAGDRLRSLIDRIERLEEERKALGSDIKDIYGEAKSAGFDVKVIRTLIMLRRKEPAEIEELETLLDVYRRAIGM